MIPELILRIDVANVSNHDIIADYYRSSDAVVMVDSEDSAVEFSRETAIAAARAILKHFGETAA